MVTNGIEDIIGAVVVPRKNQKVGNKFYQIKIFLIRFATECGDFGDF